LSDLERTVNNQLQSVRKSVMAELETRVAATAEASAAAQAGTQRIDRELSTVKTDAARMAQRAETLKAMDDRLAGLVRAVQEQAAKLEAEVSGLKGDVLKQFANVARPQDVASALQPVTTKLSALDSRVQEVIKGEQSRKANAQRIVLSLEMGNLKRVLNRGGPFADELDAVQKASSGALDLKALEPFKSAGVPTASQLATEFRAVAFKVINAEKDKGDGTVIDRLMSRASSIVRVRRTNFESTDTSVEAVVARIEQRVKQGNLTGALDQSKQLSDKARKPAHDWLERLAARANVDRVIAELEDQLKASLGGGNGLPAKSGTKG